MKKDKTKPKLQNEEDLEETGGVIVPGEQGDINEGVQARANVPAREQDSPPDSTAVEERESRHSKQGDEEQLSIPDVLPVLPLKDTVVYPFAVQPLGVGQERSIRLIDDVMRGDRLVVLVAQKSAEMELAGPDDIFKIGTVSRIARMIRMPDGTIQIIVQGL